MTVIDIFAGVAYLSLDVVTLLGLIGSAILAIGDVIAAWLGRRFRPPEQIFTWISSGWLVGVGGLISLKISGQYPMNKTLWLGWSMTTIVVMLSASILLLVAGKILQIRIRRTRWVR
jgi:hypothetical protein